MRECVNCKIILEDDVRFCPRCGGEIAGKGRGEPVQSTEVAALLTSANLHRAAERWDEAAADVLQAFRLDPTSSSVAFLLADIYEQRGDLEEAAVWYKIASELDPGNDASRMRLQRVGEQVRASARGAGGRLSRRARIWLSLAGLAVMAVIATTLIVQRTDTTREKPTRARPVRPAASAASPSRTRPTDGTMTTVTPPSVSTLSGAPSSEPPAVRTPAEAAIKTSSAESAAVQATGAKIDDVIADPRQYVAIVTFSVPGGITLTKQRILTAAVGVARAAFAANSEVKYVTARCMVVSGAQSGGQIAFVGDTARAYIESLGENPTQEQLDAAFANAWWNPLIK